ncbi:ABC-type transporter ATP-binding protein EcsA [compost metagenome]
MKVIVVDIQEGGYSSNEIVVKDIQFEISEGELVGLIGPNGAGKSTTIKSIIGLLPYVKGDISIKNGKGSYSYIPEQPILYEGLTLYEHLIIASSSYEKNMADSQQEIDQLLKKFRLEEFIHKYPTSFSKGMQQKVMLILSFLLRPDIYIIDEPFIGLDPVAIKDFLELINQERNRGAAVLMSTHVLDSAERICDRFILLNNGQISTIGTLEQVQEKYALPQGTLFDCFHKMMKDGIYD